MLHFICLIALMLAVSDRVHSAEVGTESLTAFVKEQLSLRALSQDSQQTITELSINKSDTPEELVTTLVEGIETVLLHEYRLRAEYSRWFTTGVSYILAQQFLITLDDETYRDALPKISEKPESIGEKDINLASWRRGENQQHVLHDLRTTYAIAEVQRWVDEYGEAIIPTLFRDLSRRGTPVVPDEANRLPQLHRSMRDVFQAIRSVTGIAMHTRLLRYTRHWSEVELVEEVAP